MSDAKPELTAALQAFAALIEAEIRGIDPGRFRRAAQLCVNAHRLAQLYTTRTVGDIGDDVNLENAVGGFGLDLMGDNNLIVGQPAVARRARFYAPPGAAGNPMMDTIREVVGAVTQAFRDPELWRAMRQARDNDADGRPNREENQRGHELPRRELPLAHTELLRGREGDGDGEGHLRRARGAGDARGGDGAPEARGQGPQEEVDRQAD